MSLPIVGRAFVGLCLFVSSHAFATSDGLGQQTIAITSSRSALALDRTVANIRGVFERYVPAVDSSSKIVSPLRVTGSASAPEIQVSIQKCVLVMCETVDLDAEISVRTVSGPCAKNFILTADLHRSGKLLTDVYDRLVVSGCYQATSGGAGRVAMAAEAHRAPSYSQGTVQREIFKMLRLQIPPILRALDLSLRANSH